MWLSRRAIALHIVIIVVVPSFVALCVWQLHRALSGNDLSWAYVFEWPFFAGYAVYMWWRFVHEGAESPDGRTATPARRAEAPPDAGSEAEQNGVPSEGAGRQDSEAADMAAYNDYLADLAERGKPKHW
jgi:hypothetical protein